MLTGVERCRLEQALCRDYILSHDDSSGRRGAELGLADWLMEEILLGEVVGPTELESVTSCVSSRRSNQLSYGPRTAFPIPSVSHYEPPSFTKCNVFTIHIYRVKLIQVLAKLTKFLIPQGIN